MPRAGSLTRGDSLAFSSSRCFDTAAVSERDEPDAAGAAAASGPPSPPPKPQRSGSVAHFQRTDSMAQLHQMQMSCRDLTGLETAAAPVNRVVSYHASGSDSGNGSGDSAQSSAAGDPLDGSAASLALGQTTQGQTNQQASAASSSSSSSAGYRGGVHIKNPRFMSTSVSSATLKSYDADFDYMAVERTLMEAAVPQLQVCTQFDLENYETLLLPAVENRPLDNGALNTFRMMLSETGPRVLANHLTRIDIRLILELNAGAEADGQRERSECAALTCATGIELVSLAHGDQFRTDLLERTECLRLLVAVTVLTCNCDEERAETLNKWIQVAVDTKTALGNLFGFCAIMLGLCMPQVRALDSSRIFEACKIDVLCLS